MPRITKPWLAFMDTEDVFDLAYYDSDKTPLVAIILFITFCAGSICSNLSSTLPWLLAAGLVGTGSSFARIWSTGKRTNRQEGVSVVTRAPLMLRSQSSMISRSPVPSPRPALQRAGSSGIPTIPMRSQSAMSLKAFAFANANRDISSRDSGYASLDESEDVEPIASPQSLSEAAKLYQLGRCSELSNAELIELCINGTIPVHSLESVLDNDSRAIFIRRNVLVKTIRDGSPSMTVLKMDLDLPFEGYDFSRVRGRCAENVIGYMPLPVGVAGPLKIDSKTIYIPMATTEGTLIASTSRGCKAINAAGGVSTVILADGMTRAPVVRFPDISEALEAKQFIESNQGFCVLRNAFQGTTNHGNLLSVTVRMAGSFLYLRFKASTGEAMGMNIVGKGVHAALSALLQEQSGIFENMQVVSLSGNYCSDKKPSAINWIEGRGKSVVAEAVIPQDVVTAIFRCSVDSLVALNTSKNYVGSALAGVSAGGFNAHAANIVTALFLATGQDPAQNVESSNCITMMEKTAQGALQMSVSMPSLEVGTVGGGTELAPQASMLNLLGVKDVNGTGKGENASHLARVIAAAVLAGELSLCAALATGDLIKAHMALNRNADVPVSV